MAPSAEPAVEMACATSVAFGLNWSCVLYEYEVAEETVDKVESMEEVRGTNRGSMSVPSPVIAEAMPAGYCFLNPPPVVDDVEDGIGADTFRSG